ncbi:hypothetical protein NM688_g8461 [Phlebia brevispora]|uniref:Uncharacterized protein n=1 Tax=Phlebia brevispora TaxID=194682 RepID=A0ACC1RTN4_9APHY|nr:hypothetical protein NM688_g8461 [Phlebia brevispora]
MSITATMKIEMQPGLLTTADVFPQLWEVELPLRDGILAIVFCGLVAHAIFKRWEPMRLSVVFPLLVLVPGFLSTLLSPHFSRTQSICVAFLAYIGTLLTSIVLYRIGPFHPLARYPGPLPARISKLWHVWIVSRGKQHLYLQRMHEKYGDVVRMGPNELCIRDASCIIPVMGATGLPKGPSWAGRNLHPKIPALIADRDPAEHARRRKPWNRAFNTSSLREFQPVIVKRVHELVECLGERQGQIIDLAEWVSWFTYDFMGDMVYGGWTDMMKNGSDNEGLWHLIKSGLDVAVLYEHAPWISYYTAMFPWVGNDLKTMRKMGFARTEQRYQQGSTTRDLFYYLSNEDGAEKVPPPRHIVIGDGVLALIAGSDTTATVLSNTLWCLLCHPEAYKRLQEEVDKFYPPGEDSLDGKYVNDMPYLEAVV